LHPWAIFHKFLQPKFTNVRHKLECLSMASLSSLI
jgi:hypothetical protein